MEIDIAELKVAVDKLFAHLQQSGWNVVSIPHDYYWAIPKETRYDPSSQPSELTLGQLSDDLAELRRIADGEAEPLPYALTWLASIVRVLGEEIVV